MLPRTLSTSPASHAMSLDGVTVSVNYVLGKPITVTIFLSSWMV